MFSTSQDILNLILSISVIVLAFFFCWALYYFIATAHRIHRLVKRVENSVGKAEEIVETIKSKLKNSGTYLMILGEIAKKAVEFMHEKKSKKSTRKKK